MREPRRLMALRRKRFDLGRYVPPKETPPAPTLEESVDDAVLIAGAAIRLAVKNDLIMRALRDRLDYSHDELVAVARAEIEALADEKVQDAARLDHEATVAKSRPGEAEFQSDYRAADVPSLTMRRDVFSVLATRLAELARDETYLAAVVATSRNSALDDIMGAVSSPRSRSVLSVVTDAAEWQASTAALIADLGSLGDTRGRN